MGLTPLQYLPEIFHDNELMQFLTDCIAHVMEEEGNGEFYKYSTQPDGQDLTVTPDMLDDVYVDAGVVRPSLVRYENPSEVDLLFRSDDMLIPTYADAEAINAYYVMFVYPLIGTRFELDRLLELYSMEATIFEWFEWEPRLPVYAMYILFRANPNVSKVMHLYNLLKTYKNERTNILRVFSPSRFCGDVLTLSVNFLDNQTLSIPTGEGIEGTHFCFGNDYDYHIVMPTAATSVEAARYTRRLYNNIFTTTQEALLTETHALNSGTYRTWDNVPDPDNLWVGTWYQVIDTIATTNDREYTSDTVPPSWGMLP